MDQANIDKIKEDRTARYGGDATRCHGNLGILWTALLQNHYGMSLDHVLPSSLVLNMMAACKLNRIAVEAKVFEGDSFDDAVNYVQLAEAAKAHETGEAPRGK